MSSASSLAPRPLSPGTARVVEEMVVMLGEMDLHEVHAGDLARRAGVAIPTVYYNFRSMADIIVEATVIMLHRFVDPFFDALHEMSRALDDGDAARFRVASGRFLDHCWSREVNEEVHRLAPLIAHVRQVAPRDVRLREIQAREVGLLVDALRAAQSRGWISPDDDATAFAVVHYTCVLAQAVFWHPAFGRLTTIDFSGPVGRLRYQTRLHDDIREFPVRDLEPDAR